jgi:hypothetical protein
MRLSFIGFPIMSQGNSGRIIAGYHGCEASLASRVLAGRTELKPSVNAYDWLGKGVYFWEHGPQRAYEWAIEQAQLSRKKISRPAVIGAIIDLGICLDLLDTANTRLLRKWFATFRTFMRQNGLMLPQNRSAPGSRPADKVLRFRDCAVIDFTTGIVAERERISFQTIRGIFLEGQPAFPSSKIMLKSRIQIAVRDYRCIRGYFRPDFAEYGDQG